MTGTLIRSLTPEEEELDKRRAEVAALSATLAEKEQELEDLRIALSRFNSRYLEKVGRKYAELDEVLAKVAEAEARRKPQDKAAAQEATTARAKASETAAELRGQLAREREISGPDEATDECKRLYRKIATIIHPDKSTDETSREVRTRLMAELNEAYAQRDVNRMREILREWDSSPDTVTGDGAGADLVRVIRTLAQIRRRIARIEEETRQVKASDVFGLMDDERKAREAGRDLLAEMATAVQSRVDQAKQQLSALA